MRTNNYNFLSYLGWGLILVGFLLGSWGLTTFKAHYSWKDLNLIGDYLSGAVGTIWTLAGTIFIIQSFVQQKSDLIEQRKDFESQAFDNTFFNLLSTLKHSLIDIEKKLSTEKNDGYLSILVDIKRIGKENVLDNPKNRSVLINLSELFIEIMTRIDLYANKNENIRRSNYHTLIKGSLNDYQKEVLKLCIAHYFNEHNENKWLEILNTNFTL